MAGVIAISQPGKNMKTKTKREKRTVKVNVRARKNEDGTRTLYGMPIVYDKKSEDLGFFETIKRGAAKNALERSDVRVLYGHNSDTLLPLGRTSAGTARAYDSDEGVMMEVDLPDTQFARDLQVSIDRGDVDQMSFAFDVLDDVWRTEDGVDHRDINEIGELYDFSVVVYPAYQDTTVALRSLEQHKRSGVTASELDVTIENEDIEIDLLLNNTNQEV